MEPIETHKKIDRTLCGEPVDLQKNGATVKLTPGDAMVADETGLVHGGFIFGLADYAAMLAVNHPNVVLGAADVKFLKPVACGETVVAKAQITEEAGKKRVAEVSVFRGDDEVFKGTFTCFVLDKHVLGES